MHSIGQHSHQESTGDGAEESIGFPFAKKLGNKTNKQTADTAAETVDPVTAEKQGMTGGAQKVTRILHRQCVAAQLFFADMVEPVQSFLRCGLSVADGTA